MSVALVSGDRQDRLADPLCARLDGMLAELAAAVAGCAELRDVGEVTDRERIDRIGRLEQLKAAVGALQAAESVRFAESQVEQQIAAEVHPRAVGRGIADQIALACQVSPTEGSRRLGPPTIFSAPVVAGCGGGGCSPPRPAARWWVGIGSAAASTDGWPS